MKVKCPICGAPLENESCSYCGFVIEHSTTTEIDVLHGISRKSRMEALLLCIFLLDEGILTQEEFCAEKKRVLEK